MKFQSFNEGRVKDEINKLQKNFRDDITKLVSNWKNDVDDALYDLTDNFEHKNMNLTWDLTPKYSISGYNRDIVKGILNKCNLLYKITFVLKPDEIDDFLDAFFYVKEFLKSYSDTDIIIYELVKRGNRYRRPYKSDLGLEKKLKDIISIDEKDEKIEFTEIIELVVNIN
jgi:hypothetical protein